MPVTPDNRVDIVHELCEIISKNPHVDHAYVNDFGRYSNFDIHIVPTNYGKGIYQRINKVFKDAVEEIKINCKDDEAKSVHGQYSSSPEYTKTHAGRKEYYKSFYSFDVDFLKDSEKLLPFTEFDGSTTELM